MISSRPIPAILLAGILPAWPIATPVKAQTQTQTQDAGSPVVLSASYIGDMVLTGGPGGDGRVRYLDDVQLSADADGARLFGWQGMSARLNILSNVGGTPNDGARTLQGIDNIEVAKRRVRLYEAWVEQRVGAAGHSLRLGLYDINCEFYATPAAEWLVMPAFGIGSELAASGPNGPSTYPLTALGGRARATLGRHGGYAMAAIVNAEVGLVNGWQGLRRGKPSGLLLAEAGIENGRIKIAAGAWRYTRVQPVFPPPGLAPDGRTAAAKGGYILAQYRMAGGKADRPVLHVFGRIGLADGRTTPFGGGAQAGALVERPFAGRPDGALSFGINTGRITDAYRAVPIGTPRPPRAETGLEVTYADRIAPFLTLQPDLQYVLKPADGPGHRPVIVAIMRTRIELSRP